MWAVLGEWLGMGRKGTDFFFDYEDPSDLGEVEGCDVAWVWYEKSLVYISKFWFPYSFEMM